MKELQELQPFLSRDVEEAYKYGKWLSLVGTDSLSF
jgi:hypothetical protein